MFELSRSNLAVSIKVKQIKGLLQVLLSEHLVEVRSGRDKLRVFNLTVAVQVYLLHYLL